MNDNGIGMVEDGEDWCGLKTTNLKSFGFAICKQENQNTSMVIKIDFMVTETTELPEIASHILQIVT